MSKIFVSHVSEDRATVHGLSGQLRDWGFNPFVYYEADGGVLGGAQWEQTVLEAIRSSSAVLLCVSPEVRNSLWCFAEIMIARYEGKPVIPVILRGDSSNLWAVLRTNIQYVDLSQDPAKGWDRLRSALGRLVSASAEATSRAGMRPPYRGLASLAEEDSIFFFGRTQDLSAALARLQRNQLTSGHRRLVLVGPSGVGKSSFVRAAVTPALRHGGVPGSEDWKYLSVRPAPDPFRRLAEQLRRITPDLGGVREILASLTADDAGLSMTLSDAMAVAGADAMCLFLDQLEELVSQVPPEVSRRFLSALRQAAHDLGRDRLVLVATLRVDYLEGLLTAYGDDATWLLQEPTLLGPLARTELEQVIRKPAEVAGLAVEAEMVQRLLADSTQIADPLPLTSYVLRTMYDGLAGRNRFTLADYQATGGLEGALAQHAEAIVSAFPAERQAQTIDAIARNLATISAKGVPARRRARRDEFDGEMQSTIEQMVESRLLFASVDDAGHATVEVAHEALFRYWPRLASAIELLNADPLYARKLMQSATESWRRSGDLPRQSEFALMVENLEWSDFTDDTLEVTVAYICATQERLDWLSDFARAHPQRVAEAVAAVLRRGLGLVTYGLLTPTVKAVLASVVDFDEVARQRADEPVEAIRRSARRHLAARSASPSVDQDGQFVDLPATELLAGTRGSSERVEVWAVRMSRFTVTNLEYARFVAASGYDAPRHWLASRDPVDAVSSIADLPVVFVNYFDALAYCEYLSAQRQETVRLPAEIEWEYAFRFPDHPLTDFPWGDDFSSVRCNTSESGIGVPTPVGLFSPHGGDSPAGLADMTGNVWEWTLSPGRLAKGELVHYPTGFDGFDPSAAHEFLPRVQRGGTFLAGHEDAIRTSRLINLPDLRLQDFGFRVCIDPAGGA
ncbi:SUMF1/EgtB/PvdO family nonheme iron enzyme [Micromonospora sp. NPDC051006]|uniref:nSTAND1 domain-containing NTPase n=1 Tax=Micromonospora sp. NPDC051006 TaxID=3364283 RepID=UPI0037B5331C